MSFDKDQNDLPLPAGNNKDQRSFNLLPKYFRTELNKKFLSSTLDQMTLPGVVEKVNSFVGRRWAKAATFNDNYLSDVSVERENYQLEPVTVYKDELNNVEFLKDYNDYIGQIKNFKGSVSNHSLTNSQEFYSWDPHIDWDKFTNYREYYWLPFGPSSVPVTGQARSIISTYTVTLADDGDNFAYVFTPDGITKNPSLKLYRGQTYRFEINTPGHPFAIAQFREFLDNDPGFGISITNQSTLYKDGVSSETEYVENGTIEFTVPDTAPDVLFYISKNSINTSGQFIVLEITENTEINVEAEILGKKTYKTSNGFELSNGMKVYFQGNVIPKKYSSGNWYVEGVGDAIRLVAETDLEIPAIFTSSVEVPFDSNGFDSLPFEDATSFAGTKDYIVINRVSADRNPWSRYNRWFHRSVIEKSAEINNQTAIIDQSARAKRPIIEFEAGLKLYNHGWKAKANVTLVDDFTKDVFSTIEGSVGYNVDGVDLVDGMRVLFTADPDIFVNGKIYEVKFIVHNGVRQLTLLETFDSAPVDGETVLVTDGKKYKGKMFYYETGSWKKSQEKTSVNQAPMFDLFDKDANKFDDELLYPSSNFSGNRVFSYKVSESIPDVELGFPLTYRNISNIGDIVFDFNLLSDIYSYQTDERISVSYTSDTGFLKKYDYQGNTFIYLNGWTKASTLSEQAVIRTFVVNTAFDDFPVDVFDNSATLNDLRVVVFVNGKRKKVHEDYRFEIAGTVTRVIFNYPLAVNDLVLLKCYSKADKNNNGYYEIPYNLEKNPLNENITSFTLGEVYDHVDSIIENLSNFTGSYPGISNLRDLGNVTAQGRRFLQHSGPLNLSLFHVTDKNSNVVKSIKYAKREYAKFKRQFIREIESFGFDGTVKDHVDRVLENLNRDKVKTQPFYFSDMVGYESSLKTTHRANGSSRFFAMSQPFTMNELSTKSVNVYLNSQQLLYKKDYIFNDNFVEVLVPLADNDIVEVFEYESTSGSFIPPTPTKLGLYPKFEPQLLIDDTYNEPRLMIQGHDGSLILAFGDYRDDLILELEKRIYNNIKVDYTQTLLDIFDFIGGNFRNTNISKEQIDSVLLSDFSQWLDIAGTPDYTSHNFWDNSNAFTFNYSTMTDREGKRLSGFWRSIYKEYYDTDRPHTHPWEMLGFSEKPSWWNQVYGPSPYTRNNTILWTDLSEGVVREPNKPIIRKEKFRRPSLLNIIPVDESGNLLDPITTGLAQNFVLTKTKKEFVFGDNAPVEAAWRRSSEYPFALLNAWAVLRPSMLFSLGFDVSRITRDLTGSIVYTETGKRIATKDIVFPSISTNEDLVLTSGLVNFISNYMSSFKITQDVNKNYEEYKQKLTNITNQLAIKLGGFADKSKINLVLDSKSPLNKSNVFVPEENYQIVLNTSSPLDTVVYSGIIIEKVENGFIVSGYDKEDPVFRYNKPLIKSSDPSVTVGGISESFVSWAPNNNYVIGKVVEYQNAFYRTKMTHRSSATFDTEKFSRLASLPVAGGVTSIIRTAFDDTVTLMPYGTYFSSIQDVVDFMLGYEHLNNKLGFKLEYFNKETSTLEDMSLCVKEFMFWVTQNWDIGTILSVSPIANKVLFERKNFVVDDIYDNFYEYTVLTGTSERLQKEFVSVFRDTANQFGIVPVNTEFGIYLIKLPLVQKEHVILIDNTTVFNDVIFDKVPGYRQERIKVVGYRTADWTGSLSIPGFFYDEAKVKNWEPWTDYAVGDLVKYKEFYYSANLKHTSTDFFDANQWNILNSAPESELLPNWDYRTTQISDFYDLESDNFDIEQQRLSQHLIGYQKRDYLANIINDDVSQYKFYQGFIQDKGTLNSLNKLFEALTNSDKDSLEFYEEWAIRVGQYGAVSNLEELEIVLDETKFRQEPQNLELVKAISSNRLDLVYEVLPTDIIVKPEEYTHSPFPLLNDKDVYTRDRGYVRDQDVNFIVDSVEDILNLNIDLVDIGSYIWILNSDNTWNVWRHIDTGVKVQSLQSNGTSATITLDDFNNFNIGDVIGLGSANQKINGFYKITSIGLKSVTFETRNISGADVEDFTDSTIISVTTFVKRRFSDYEDINNNLYKLKQLDNEKIWLDSFEGAWATLENKNIFSQFAKIDSEKSVNTRFGKSFDVNRSNTVMVIGIPDDTPDLGLISLTGSMKIYKRFSEVTEWFLLQNLKPVTDYGDFSRFGSSSSISADAKYIAVGAPEANNDFAKQGAVYFYVKDEYEKYQAKLVLFNPTPVLDDQFGTSVQFRTDNTSTKLFVGSRGSSKIYVYDIVDNLPELSQIIEAPAGHTDFAKVLEVNTYGDVLVTSAKLNDDTRILVYRKDNSTWTFSQAIDQFNNLESFGYSFAVDPTGMFIAIGAPRNDSVDTDNGCVYVFMHVEDEYVLHQTINSPFTDYNEMFGTSLDFSDNKLVISSKNGDLKLKVIFDENKTVFDNAATTFVEETKDVGKIYVYQNIENNFVYGEDLTRANLSNSSYEQVIEDITAYLDTLKFRSIENFKINNNKIYLSVLDSKNADDTIGSIVEFSSKQGENSWSVLSKQESRVDLTKIKRCFLYNKKENKIISNLDFIDPRQGKIAGPAEQELSFKTFFDPAIYTNNDQESNINVDTTNAWTTENVGKLWWNLSFSSWYNPYQGSTMYRSNWWNKLVFNSKAVVAEWVESEITPAEWDRITETNEGIGKGITGRPLYQNTYTAKKVYDPISNNFKNKYYFWVVNKKTIPQVTGRALSAFEVASLIEDPSRLGYKFVSFLSNNSFALYNVKNLVEDKNTVIHFTMVKDDANESNIHFEYQLLTEGIDNSLPSQAIEQKWFDSLVGYDLNNRLVPDPQLSVKEKYGILNTPCQSMFVNRFEALKQLIERANNILIKNQTIDSISDSSLFDKDEIPDIKLGKYDEIVDARNQLAFVSVAKVETAILQPVIVNGRIVSVNIVNPGRGYKSKPSIFVDTITGSGALFDVQIDNLGKIVSVNVRSQGRNYSSNDELFVRKFSVLIRSDDLIKNRWSIVEWDKISQSWIVTDNEKFDTTKYWNYVDWYAEGYSALSIVNFTIDESYQLYSLDDRIGDIVKINNIGTGGWLLLEKINDLKTEDYSLNYKTVGRQNGTIQLSKELYDYAFKISGFDVTVYDSQLYDTEPTTETRNIILALKNDLFVGDLAVEWNKLFFASVRYAMSEQNFVDWIFKTSFIRAKHNLGLLSQKITFQNDNLESYEEYIKEVKPYATKIREYISNYIAEDNTRSLVTDFDLQPSYDDSEKKIEVSNAKVKNSIIENLKPKYEEYPFKSWFDNVGLELVSIEVVDGGDGYLQTPEVTILGVQGSTAKAYLSKGKVSTIEIINTGERYLKTPQIVIEGNLADNGRPAKAVAILGNSKVRSSKVEIKFDRVSGNYDIANLSETEFFVGTGAQQTFRLKWPVDVRKGNYSVYINNLLVLPTQYSVGNIVDVTKGYTRKIGFVRFNVDPLNGDNIKIVYNKDITLLSAADRIKFFYKPTEGMPGNDLAQLMDGVEYAGVKLDSISFGSDQGWDVGGWSSLPWDTFSNIVEDIIVVLDGTTNVVTLSNALENGVEYNVYLNNVRIDDPNFGTPEQTNNNAVMTSIEGTGQTTVDLTGIVTLNDGDLFILRKTTSDGSFTPVETAYDVALSSGSFVGTQLVGALGVEAGEIIVDGDGFVTPTTSKGPEELVPGQILDTLDIKVYNKPTNGVGIISNNSYLINDQTTFKFDSLPHSRSALIVKVDNNVISPTLYSIDYNDLSITLDESVTGERVSITSIGTNGLDIKDTGNVTLASGQTSVPTLANWTDNELYAFVSKNGIVLREIDDYVLVKSNSGKVDINLVSSMLDDVVVYAIYNEPIDQYSQVIIDNTFQSGNSNNYHIFDETTTPIPFNRKPVSNNILVKVGNRILNAGYSIHYTINTARDYPIESWQFEDLGTVNTYEVFVYINENKLSINDYIFDKFNSRILLVNENVIIEGAELRIYIISNSEYYFVDTKITLSTNVTNIDAGDIITVTDETANDYTFTVISVTGKDLLVRSYNNSFMTTVNNGSTLTIGSQNYQVDSVECVESNNLTFRVAPLASESVSIYQFSNHDVNNFRRYTYEVLNRVSIVNANEARKRDLLSYGIILLESPAVESKYVWVIKNGILLTPEVDYVLENSNRIKLHDKVFDGDLIDVLQFNNYPIVPAFGYRIFKDILNRTHYKRLNKENSYVLAQPLNYYDVRIALTDTVGIAVPNKEKNIPGVIFIDGERIEYFEIYNNSLRQLRRGTLGTGIKSVYSAGTTVLGQGLEETIQYKDATLKEVFTADGVEYTLGFTPSSVNEIEVFVSGTKLRKTDLAVFNNTVNQDSPEADVTVEPEFSVNDNKLILAYEPPNGAKIVVARKLGKLWSEPTESLSYAENSISRFLRSATIDLPK